jgi:hypothetical protein
LVNLATSHPSMCMFIWTSDVHSRVSSREKF